MIQASAQWVYDRLGQYHTVSIRTEYVSPEIGEILLRRKDGAIFSLLLNRAEIKILIASLQSLLVEDPYGNI